MNISNQIVAFKSSIGEINAFATGNKHAVLHPIVAVALAIIFPITVVAVCVWGIRKAYLARNKPVEPIVNKTALQTLMSKVTKKNALIAAGLVSFAALTALGAYAAYQYKATGSLPDLRSDFTQVAGTAQAKLIELKDAAQVNLMALKESTQNKLSTLPNAFSDFKSSCEKFALDYFNLGSVSNEGIVPPNAVVLENSSILASPFAKPVVDQFPMSPANLVVDAPIKPAFIFNAANNSNLTTPGVSPSPQSINGLNQIFNLSKPSNSSDSTALVLVKKA